MSGTPSNHNPFRIQLLLHPPSTHRTHTLCWALWVQQRQIRWRESLINLDLNCLRGAWLTIFSWSVEEPLWSPVLSLTD